MKLYNINKFLAFSIFDYTCKYYNYICKYVICIRNQKLKTQEILLYYENKNKINFCHTYYISVIIAF